jgi:hypothetical protein
MFLDDQDIELEAFKREIDLRRFAIGMGYAIDRGESWRGSAVMRRGPDKIVVKRNGNGHYVFFSVRDDDDSGSIIDFLQRRRNLSLGAVRQVLRPWTSRSAAAPPLPKLQPTNPDRAGVERAYRRLTNQPLNAYLLHERRLPSDVLQSPRFAGRIRTGERGNAVFPHFDTTGLCGYEVKNRGFTGFAAGGEKGLWFSHTRPDDRRLVLAESAIDALSYAALFPDAADQTRYASVSGQLSSKQPELIRATMARLPQGAEVVAAFDADAMGHRLAEIVRQAVSQLFHQSVRSPSLRVHLPLGEGKDWNEVLKRTKEDRPRP